jgi:hypothetical protein
MVQSGIRSGAPRVLFGIGGYAVHFAAPDCDTIRLVARREHVERRVIAAVLGQAMIVAAELARATTLFMNAAD